jgi:tetratricopeptide (TPR) repeat protein
VLVNYAECEFYVGNLQRAIDLGREVLARDRNRRDASSLCFALANLAAYLIASGQIDEAYHLANEALRKAADVQYPVLIACSLQHLAAIAALRGDHERASLLLGYTNKAFSEATPREDTEKREYNWIVATLQNALGQHRLNDLLQRGETMPEENAIAEGLKI